MLLHKQKSLYHLSDDEKSDLRYREQMQRL